MGDFNIDLLNFESHPPTNEFINNMGVYRFKPHIIQPTRVTDHSATLVDHIYFNSRDHFTISGNLFSDISDHFPNFLIINKISSSYLKPAIYRRDYSNFKEDKLLEEVQQINWESALPDTNDVNLIFDAFYTKISLLINYHVPLKKLSKKEIKLQAKPWITKGLRTSIAQKNKLYKKSLKTLTIFRNISRIEIS